MTKILLVEDDKSLREIYGVRLLAEGYDIVSAGDGEEALAMAIKDRPSLIVSDVMMPKISGFDMLDILRSTTETKDIKVIMMTALSSEDQRERGQQLGADRYLVKSQVGIEDVVRSVHEVLGDSPAAPGAQNPFQAQQMSAVPRPTDSSVSVPTRSDAPAATTPAPEPTPVPATPQLDPQPQAQPEPASAPADLPQPTAPFSTNRPGASLSDRVIQPIEKPAETGEPMANRFEKELAGGDNQEPEISIPEPVAAVAAQPDPQPQVQQSTEPVAAPEEPAQQPQPAAPASPFTATQASSPASAEPQPAQQPQSQPQEQSDSGMSFEETPQQTTTQ